MDGESDKRTSSGTLTLSTARTPAASSLVLFRNSLALVVALAPVQPAAPTSQAAGPVLLAWLRVLEDSVSLRPGNRALDLQAVSSVAESHLMSSEQNQSDNTNHVMVKIISRAVKGQGCSILHLPTYSTLLINTWLSAWPKCAGLKMPKIRQQS